MAFTQANLSLKGRSQLPRGLRRRPVAARLLGLRVRIPPGYGCFSLASVVILEKGSPTECERVIVCGHMQQ